MVKQGNPISTTLFGIAMDSILKKMELRGNISTRLKQCTACADDILITTRTTQAMIDMFVKLKNDLLKCGLIVNVHKTKYLKCSRRQDQPKPINIEDKEFEQVKSFKYLGSTVNADNTVEEEIKERIALGNKAFFANKKMFQSKIISKMAKLKFYCSVIRPVVIYACETWTLKKTMTNRLVVFERKVLRKIFGPTIENGIWQIKTNQELDKIKHKNIINVIRAKTLGWLGRIERMQETGSVEAIHSWKPISKRPIGRPETHWEDDVRKDIQKCQTGRPLSRTEEDGRNWLRRPKLYKEL